MFVMRKQEYLGSFRQTGELWKDGPGTLIVECDQQVIENEGHRLVRVQVLIERGEPEGQVKLIASAFTHPSDGNGHPIWSQSH